MYLIDFMDMLIKTRKEGAVLKPTMGHEATERFWHGRPACIAKGGRRKITGAARVPSSVRCRRPTPATSAMSGSDHLLSGADRSCAPDIAIIMGLTPPWALSYP